MNLLDTLDGNGWSIQHAIQTTFPFDPQFYSSYVRPRLNRRNCDLPLVLVDGRRYERDITDAKWQEAPIGTDYLLEPVGLSGVFHPKICLFASERSVFYSITSANLTLEEYCKAAQIGYAGAYNQRTQEASDAQADLLIAKDVKNFFEDLLAEPGLITGQDARNYVTQTLETLEWLDDEEIVPTDHNRSTWLLSNVEQPILTQAIDQLETAIGGYTIEVAQLYAPFYGTPHVLERLDDVLEADRYEFLVESESTTLDLEGLADTLSDVEYDIREFNATQAARWVHAKFINLRGPWGSACLYGSPNMTSLALLENHRNGNIEAGLLTVELSDSPTELPEALYNSSAFQIELSEPISDVESLDLRDESYEGWESISRRDGPQIRLDDARLTQPGNDGQSELILSISGETDQPEFTVTANTGPRKVVSGDACRDNEISVHIAEHERPEWVSAVVQVVIDGASSNPRRVVEKMEDYYREFRDIIGSSGTQSSNTLLREILQNPDSAAISVFDVALSELQRTTVEQEADGKPSQEDAPPSFPERNPARLSTGGRSTPSLSSIVDQHLTFHRQQANQALEFDGEPTKDDLDEFIDHARTFWETIELCFILERVGDIDKDRINQNRLFSNCEQAVSDWLGDYSRLKNQLNSLVNQIDNNQTLRESFIGGEKAEIEEFPEWRSVSEVLFLHPGLVLELDHVSRFNVYSSNQGVANRLVTTFQEIHPYIGSNLVDSGVVTRRVDALIGDLTVEFTDAEQELHISGMGIRLILLYILIQMTLKSENFLDGLRNHPRFSQSSLSQLAEFALEAEGAMIDFGLMSRMQKEFVLKDQFIKIKNLE